jgi:hypothetical protein
MARRTELQGICHDMLSAFCSRNNDLSGYWALGQFKNWLEDGGKNTLIIPLTSKANTEAIPQFSEVSNRFTTMLYALMANHQMQSDWVLDAQISLELTAANRVQCSISLVSDLGRSFEARCNLLVRRHDRCRELRRAT